MIGAVILTTPVGGALGEIGDDDAPALPSPEPVADGAAAPTPDPSLTPEQEKVALAVLAEDPRADAFLSDTSYQVSDIGPWGGYTASGKAEPVIGAILMLRLDRPTAYPMQEWPLLRRAASQDPPYEQVSLQMRAWNVQELVVNVDLPRERVVRIYPFGDDVEMTPGPDVPDGVASNGE